MVHVQWIVHSASRIVIGETFIMQGQAVRLRIDLAGEIDPFSNRQGLKLLECRAEASSFKKIS